LNQKDPLWIIQHVECWPSSSVHSIIHAHTYRLDMLHWGEFQKR
jgi:hypothetical protein